MAFLNFDLDEALNGGGFAPFKVETSLDGDTTDALQKTIEFQQPEMGMFDHVSVVKFPDGTAWLDFSSKKYAPNSTLMDFMAYCTRKWGLDSKKQGFPCEKDTERLKTGHFGRYWPNVKILQCKRADCMSISIHMRIIIDNQDIIDFAKELAKRSSAQADLHKPKTVKPAIVTKNTSEVRKPVAPNEKPQPKNASSSSTEARPPIYAKTTSQPSLVSKAKHFSTGKIVWLTLASIFLMPLGSAIVLIYGISLFMTRVDDGTLNNENLSAVLGIKKRNGKIAMIIGAIGIVLFSIIMMASK